MRNFRWIKQAKELGATYDWVQIFENKGSIMGCSNPHPHCQIWASSFMPNEPRIKDVYQREYYETHGRPLLLDYVNAELKKQVYISSKLVSSLLCMICRSSSKRPEQQSSICSVPQLSVQFDWFLFFFCYFECCLGKDRRAEQWLDSGRPLVGDMAVRDIASSVASRDPDVWYGGSLIVC